jgi:hypothetical protein
MSPGLAVCYDEKLTEASGLSKRSTLTPVFKMHAAVMYFVPKKARGGIPAPKFEPCRDK